MKHPVLSVKVYVAVFVALIVLLLATFATDFVDLGKFNALINLTIAVVKALLVILFFMHVRDSEHVVRVYVVAGIFWLAILIALTMADVLTRAPV